MSSFSTVLSVDGTRIAYRERGDGPGVVLIHGAMQAAQNFSRLAAALSSSFHVYVPDRRGRGQSGPFGSAYGLAREAEDLDVLLRKTGARFVFGLSSGALIGLHAARQIAGIAKLALYEPPVSVDGADAAEWVPRYERAMDRGRLAAAMVTAIKGTGDVDLLTHVPGALLVPWMSLALRADAAKDDSDRVRIRDLVPTIRYDAQLQREATRLLPRLTDVSCDVLLMSGDRSHRALRAVVDELERRMPRAKRVRLAKTGHHAADDTGRPQDVARELFAFFSG